ncbi:hypothetical protein F5884DRAFT_780597 [Xylogone sp. PMI_703]|nr:hypothetical protein F5884DRAFT_780597 [Xylogone sp. PMI_703]
MRVRLALINSSSQRSRGEAAPNTSTLRMGSSQYSPILPARSARPSEIRAYIAEILTSKHELAPKDADEVAAKWSLGLGAELRDELLPYFQKLFGHETGCLLYRHIHEAEFEAWKHSPAGRISYYLLILGLILPTGYILWDLSQPYSKNFLVYSTWFCFAVSIPLLNYGIRTPNKRLTDLTIPVGMFAFGCGILFYPLSFVYEKNRRRT